MRAPLLPLAFIGALALVGCDEEKAASELVGPLAGPRVGESVLALAVFEGLPVGITDTFIRDEIVHLWVRWEQLEPPHVAEAIWLDPDGDVVDSSVLDISDGPAEQITVFTLELTPASQVGPWEVELWLDREFQRSHIFQVVELLPVE